MAIFTDFMSKKFNIEKSFYQKQVVGFDPKTKEERYWQYNNQQERDHKNWLRQVQDPKTKLFYKLSKEEFEYDEDGKPIPETRKLTQVEPYFEIIQIIRLKRRNGSEYLYTRGLLYGYTPLQNIVTHNFDEPEVWNETHFMHRTQNNPKDGTLQDICEGPFGRPTIHYTLPFSKEALDRLMENAIPDVGLTVKDENGNIRHPINIQGMTAFEMFRNQSVDFIINAEWQTPEDKEKAQLEAEIIQANVITENKKRMAKQA